MGKRSRLSAMQDGAVQDGSSIQEPPRKKQDRKANSDDETEKKREFEEEAREDEHQVLKKQHVEKQDVVVCECTEDEGDKRTMFYFNLRQDHAEIILAETKHISGPALWQFLAKPHTAREWSIYFLALFHETAFAAWCDAYDPWNVTQIACSNYSTIAVFCERFLQCCGNLRELLPTFVDQFALALGCKEKKEPPTFLGTESIPMWFARLVRETIGIPDWRKGYEIDDDK